MAGWPSHRLATGPYRLILELIYLSIYIRGWRYENEKWSTGTTMSTQIPKYVYWTTIARWSSCIFLYLRGRRWCHGDSRDLNCLQFGEEEEEGAAAAVGGYPQILLLGRGSTFCRNFIQFGHHERRRSSGNRSWTAWEWVVGRPPPFNGTTHKPIKKPYR